MTNEEYIHQASTEELAKFIYDKIFYGIDEVIYIMNEGEKSYIEAIIEWLESKKE